MSRKPTKLQQAQQKTAAAADKTNEKINELGWHASGLYAAIGALQTRFDRIRNVPDEDRIKYEELKKIRVTWKQQAEKIEMEYKKAETKTAGQGAAGIGAGVAVAAMGPTAAMGVATTFGVASTGTAISTLSGAAATNAALAWLGGGALAAGGGGMAAGNALLALAGPLGWTIAGISIITSGIMFFKTKDSKERLENIYTLISKRDIRSFELAIVELSERIKRITDETSKLENAITRVETFGTDFSQMTIEQKHELGGYFNLMDASTRLLVNPILGLQPKYTEQDLEALCSFDTYENRKYYLLHKDMVISLSNLLFRIVLSEKDKKLLAKSFRKNKEFLESVKMTKDDFSEHDLTMVEKALEHRYKARK